MPSLWQITGWRGAEAWPSSDDLAELAFIVMGTEHGRDRCGPEWVPHKPPYGTKPPTWKQVQKLEKQMRHWEAMVDKYPQRLWIRLKLNPARQAYLAALDRYINGR